MKAKNQLQDGKVKWKNSRCILLTKNYKESMEKHLNSSGIFSQEFVDRKRSGMELFLRHLKENETLRPLTWWNDSKDTGHPVLQ